jgi:hypothetical protein
VRRRYGWVLALLAVLLAARIALPFALQRYVNGVLDRTPGYTGRVGDIDVALWRGAYEIEDVDIRKRSGKVPVPLLSAPRTDLSVEWKALFRGALVGELVFHGGALNFVRGPSEGTGQTGAEADWRDTVRELFPLRIDRVAVHDGTVHYRDFHSDPEVDVHLDSVEAVVINLTNSRDLAETLVARFELDGRLMGQGPVRVRGSLDPFADDPTFDLDGEVRGADLRRWNDFLRAYAGVDVQKGTFEVYTELRAEKGRFEGYVKPLVEGLDVIDLEEEAEEQSLFATLWETIVGAGAEVLEHQPADRQAARIPLSGSVEEPGAGLWAALGSAFRNAFVEAVKPRLEGSVGPP